MSNEQRSLKPPPAGSEAFIHLRGKTFKIAEAAALALSELKLGHFEAALTIYDLVIAHAPGFAEFHNNRGFVLLNLKRLDQALASFDKAIAFNPGDANAHINRGAALQKMQRHQEALASYDRAIALKPDQAGFYHSRGLALREMKRYKEALASFDRTIALKPGLAIYNDRGGCLNEMKHYKEALACFDRAIALDPDNATVHCNRGLTLFEMKRYEEALACFDKVIAIHPGHANLHNSRGRSLEFIHRLDEALAAFDRAIALSPDCAEFHYNCGMTWVSKGDMQNAERMFLKALALKPDFPDPLCSLTSIRKYAEVDHADIKNLQAMLELPGVSPEGRESLYFALGKVYDDCGLYDQAFEYFSLGNRMRNALVSYKAEVTTASVQRTLEVFSREFLARPFADAAHSPSPLFVVGMPRSGTTLMASILSNHPSIATAGELPTIAEFARNLRQLTGSGVAYPQAARQITPVVATRLINDYERRLNRDAGVGVTHVVDKHPLNFWHLGLISMLFPKARIIHCLRHPMDTALSNYFQQFSLDYDYSFDLRNIGHYYGAYARVMEHWRKVLPLEMIEISYEDMVTRTEAVVRRVLEAVGLEWDERCLAPHTNPCSVKTASKWQVRQPIYRKSLERWRHYEKHLAPLKEMLAQDGRQLLY